jgi:uncharacterized protein (DUF58 family)
VVSDAKPDEKKKQKRPRKLRFTGEGRILVGITLAVGFAAINTGHNLLFFGWGLLLSAILISGVLSEATLRSVRVRPRVAEELRAGQLSPLPLVLENPGRRLPAFGVEVVASVDEAGRAVEVAAPYQLRLSAGARVEALAPWVPRRRGEHRVTALRARTTYPFGFFEKVRHYRFANAQQLLVFPARVDVADVSRALLSRLGATSTNRAGPGEDFFTLRPYVWGDDIRRVHWRRSARSGRLVVKETEVNASREVELELAFASPPPPPAEVDRALAVLGSVAEDLLASGCSVGVRTAGQQVAPAGGAAQRAAILAALARVDARAPLEASTAARHTARVALAFEGGAVSDDVDHVVELESLLQRARAHDEKEAA